MLNTFGIEELENEVTTEVEIKEVTTTPVVTGISYPCVILECDSLENHVAIALKALVGVSVSETSYNLYIKYDGDVLLLGVLDGKALRVLLSSELFNNFKKTLYLSPADSYSGDILFAFCNITEG